MAANLVEILLFGGELSFAYQNIDRFAEERESLGISNDRRRRIILAVMLQVVHRFRETKGRSRSMNSAADSRCPPAS